jgi:hypothetical protein
MSCNGCLLCELLGLLALEGGVGGAALASVRIGESDVGFGVGGVGGDGGLELGDSFGELTSLEEGASAVE